MAAPKRTKQEKEQDIKAEFVPKNNGLQAPDTVENILAKQLADILHRIEAIEERLG